MKPQEKVQHNSFVMVSTDKNWRHVASAVAKRNSVNLLGVTKRQISSHLMSPLTLTPSYLAPPFSP